MKYFKTFEGYDQIKGEDILNVIEKLENFFISLNFTRVLKKKDVTNSNQYFLIKDQLFGIKKADQRSASTNKYDYSGIVIYTPLGIWEYEYKRSNFYGVYPSIHEPAKRMKADDFISLFEKAYKVADVFIAYSDFLNILEITKRPGKIFIDEQGNKLFIKSNCGGGAPTLNFDCVNWKFTVHGVTTGGRSITRQYNIDKVNHTFVEIYKTIKGPWANKSIITKKLEEIKEMPLSKQVIELRNLLRGSSKMKKFGF